MTQKSIQMPVVSINLLYSFFQIWANPGLFFVYLRSHHISSDYPLKKCWYLLGTERFEPVVTESLAKEVYHWARRLTLLYYVATVFDLKLFSNLFLLVRFSLLFLRLCLYVVCCHSSWSVLELLCIALFSFSSFVPAPKRERNRSPCFLIRHTARERLLWPLFPFQPIFKLLFAAETKISNFPTKPFFNYFPWRWN